MGASLRGAAIIASGTMKYVDQDAGGSHTGSTAETTLATITLPANTVANGIVVLAECRHDGSNGKWTKFRVKTGPSGSEVERHLVQQTDPGVGMIMAMPLLYADEAATYTAEVVVLITVQMNDTSAVTGTLENVVVVGY